ncbi:MAG: dimethyl sulfoxide reductase anchor subunit [Methanomicrobia archaeon]|nr:dimethyl sulfoxide reductase anchor subunit [Methanomicrobia archaeon]
MSSAAISYMIFTVFSQLSVGALIAMVVADFLAKDNDQAKFFETGAWVSVPVAVIGLIGILSHEARPIQAMMTMTKNVGTSMLSNEVLALTIFVILAVIYTILWVLHPDYGSLKWFPIFPAIVGKFVKLRKPLGVLAAIVGLGFLYVSAAAYMMYQLPSLNIITTPMFFYVTALLGGFTAVAAVLSVKYLVKKTNEESLSRMLWITMVVALVMLIVLIAALIMQPGLLGAAETEYALVARHETLDLMQTGEYATMTMARWALGVGLALILTIVLAVPLKKKNMAMAAMIVVVLFIVVLIGELMGRYVIFGTNVPMGHVLPNIDAFYSSIGL